MNNRIKILPYAEAEWSRENRIIPSASILRCTKTTSAVALTDGRRNADRDLIGKVLRGYGNANPVPRVCR